MLVAITGAVVAATASAATPGQIVAKLRAERAANGIPAAVRLDPKTSLGCVHHLRYEALNGIGWTHTEAAGKPGYTKDGMLAGLGGDQADTGSWAAGDPYENLPLHLVTLLDPRLAVVGAAESGVRSCVVVTGGYTRRFAQPAIYTVPGNGRGGVPSSQVVHNEAPFAPGDLVGLQQGTETGPTIYVYGVGGPWELTPPHVVQATLRGPAGSVPLRIVDGARHPELSAYSRPGAAFLIPVGPLAAGAYTANVTLAGAGQTLEKTWRFRVG